MRGNSEAIDSIFKVKQLMAYIKNIMGFCPRISKVYSLILIKFLQTNRAITAFCLGHKLEILNFF